MCRLKEEGGLRLKHVNQFVRLKWEILHQHDSMWCKVLRSKHGGVLEIRWIGNIKNSTIFFFISKK